jgi:uncharacterized protein
MRFDPIPPEQFEAFHRGFRGDLESTFQVCCRCGGACEHTKIGTLMPGEREYMAAKAGVSAEEFAARYLDVVVMPNGYELDVLRLIDGCPFLDPKTFACLCKAYKVVLCEIYPIGFEVVGDEVRFAIDTWCPLAKVAQLYRYFEELGIPMVSRLPVPIEWYRLVAQYDELHFDYKAFVRHRRGRAEAQVFGFEELLGCARTDLARDPKAYFNPFTEKVHLTRPL